MSNPHLIINKLSGSSLSSKPTSRTSSSSFIDKKSTCSLPHHRSLMKELENSENFNETLKNEIQDLEQEAKLQVREANKRFDDYCIQKKNELKLKDLELTKLKNKSDEILTINRSLKSEIEELKKSNLQKESAINLLKSEIAKGFNTNSSDRQIQIQKFKSEIVRLRNQMSEFLQHERDLRDELNFEKKKKCMICPE